ISGFHCGLVYISGKVSCTSGLNYPPCYCWDSEVTHNANQHKNDIDSVACIRDIRWVREHLYILFDNQDLYFCEHRAEQISYGKPQVNAHISGQPLRECGLKTVPHTYRKGNGSQYAQYNQEECSYRIYHQCSRLKQHFEQVAKPILNGLFGL